MQRTRNQHVSHARLAAGGGSRAPLMPSVGWLLSLDNGAMGVSFYSVIEYEEWDAYWAFAQVYLLHDQDLFDAIAFGDGGVTENMLYPPRGLPADCSCQSHEIFFTDDATVIDFLAASSGRDEEPSALEKYAEEHGEWASSAYRHDGFLPMPETYSHGWLSLTELKEALAQRGLERDTLSPILKALLASMEALATAHGPEKVRLLFAFGM